MYALGLKRASAGTDLDAQRFLNETGVIEALKETYGLQRDIRTLCRLLVRSSPPLVVQSLTTSQ